MLFYFLSTYLNRLSRSASREEDSEQDGKPQSDELLSIGLPF